MDIAIKVLVLTVLFSMLYYLMQALIKHELKELDVKLSRIEAKLELDNAENHATYSHWREYQCKCE